MNERAIVILLAVMVLFSAFQALQLIEIRQNMAAGNVAAAEQSTAATKQSSVSVPGSLQNLPDMVGGC